MHPVPATQCQQSAPDTADVLPGWTVYGVLQQDRTNAQRTVSNSATNTCLGGAGEIINIPHWTYSGWTMVIISGLGLVSGIGTGLDGVACGMFETINENISCFFDLFCFFLFFPLVKVNGPLFFQH